jgi:hypothetical protein
VLRRLRTELGKLPGSAEALAPLVAQLPAEGTGLTLDALRGVDDAALRSQVRTLAESLSALAAKLADEIAGRYFTLAEGLDQRV